MPSPVKSIVFVFSAYGMGQTEHPDLKLSLAQEFLALLAQADPLPSRICFYTDGVKLCVNESPVLEELRALQARGVELVLCYTCLEAYGLADQVAVGAVTGMGDIITAMTNADKVIAL